MDMHTLEPLLGISARVLHPEIWGFPCSELNFFQKLIHQGNGDAGRELKAASIFPSLNLHTGAQNFPSFSFLCYFLLVDLYLLIVPKLRSAFLDLQFCRPWASNFCCNLSFFLLLFSIRFVKDGGIGYGRHLRPLIFFSFFRIRKKMKNWSRKRK